MLAKFSDYETIFYWIEERESIRIKKEQGLPFPWTKDKILQDYRFCNVRREDDRVTKWIKEFIRESYNDHRYLWFMLCIARQINWPATLIELMMFDAWPIDEKFSPIKMGKVLQNRAERGVKVFTGAYNITAPPTKGHKKTTFVAEKTLGNLWNSRIKINHIFHNRYMEDSVLTLMDFPGWGPFLSYQAVVDMRFCPNLLENARDKYKYAAAGPGTIRGLNRLYGRDVNARLPQEQALMEMSDVYDMILKETGIELDFSDVPNVLCETDKYIRVKTGEGTTRARYVRGRGW